MKYVLIALLAVVVLVLLNPRNARPDPVPTHAAVVAPAPVAPQQVIVNIYVPTAPTSAPLAPWPTAVPAPTVAPAPTKTPAPGGADWGFHIGSDGVWVKWGIGNGEQ
jgi:hypothetical protein